MSKFNNHPKWKKYLSNVHKMKGAHLQWVNNHYAKFENKEVEAVGVTDYTNQTPSKHFTGKILSSRPQKWKKKSWNVYKKEGKHLQCVNTHYAKLEYKKQKM